MQIERSTVALMVVAGTSVLLASCSQGLFSKSVSPKPKETQTVRTAEDTQKTRLQEAYGKLPLSFIKNEGQVDERVKFYENGRGHTTFFTKDGVYLTLTRSSAEAHQDEKAALDSSVFQPGVGGVPLGDRPRGETKSELVKLSFLNSNPNPEIIAEGLQDGKYNYFIGNNPDRWRTNVPAYHSVIYQDVYPGIDLKFYGNNRQMEYDIIAKPGADTSRIELAYEGARDLRVQESGDLEIVLNESSIVQRRPAIYQVIGEKRVAVDGGFVVSQNRDVSPVAVDDPQGVPSLKPERKPDEARDEVIGAKDFFSYTFRVAAYDRHHPLIIDPVLLFSTYLGGSDHDFIYGIAVDGAGGAYLTGNTYSTDFPTTPGAFQNIFAKTSSNYSEAFVVKLNAAGSALAYATYLGGNSNGDWSYGIAVDDGGNAYVAGTTYSSDFPTTPGAYDTSKNGVQLDAFVVKLNPTGSTLVYSTYVGTSSGLGAGAYTIDVDSSGNAYVAGFGDIGFPTTPGAYDTSHNGGAEVVAFKLNTAGSALLYSTFLGGSNQDFIQSSGEIVVDSLGSAYVLMRSASTDFPVTFGAYDTTWNGGPTDGVVVKLNPTGSAVVYATYLGGSGDDGVKGLTVDQTGNAYVTG